MKSHGPRDWAVTIAFFLFLATPLAVHLATADAELGEAEKQPKAEAPAMPGSLADWLTLPRRTDDYLIDNFGLRRPMVQGFSLLNHGIGDSTSDNVLIGRDGWLYLTADDVVEQHRGLDVFSKAELDDWVASLRSLARAVRRCGARFVFVVAPNKHTIYPEFLPAWAGRVGHTTRLDQLLRRLTEHPDIRHVDLRPQVAAAKRDQQVYFRFDTHWNSVAGFLAYDATMRAAGDPRIDASILAPSDLRRETTLYQGDLARMLSLDGILVEPTLSLQVANPPTDLARQRIVHHPGGGSLNHVEVLETDRPDRPRLMIIGDSFSDGMAPFFEASASRLVRAHHRFGDFDMRLLDEHRPDLVVLEMAERFLKRPLARPAGLDEALEAGSDACYQAPARAGMPPADMGSEAPVQTGDLGGPGPP